MKLIGKSNSLTDDNTPLEDPMSGVANLFDLSIVLIVALLFALISAFNMMDLFDPQSEVTYTKRSPDGQMEIIRKKGTEINVERITPEDAAGKGVRLGTAYELEDGQVIYVPEDQ